MAALSAGFSTGLIDFNSIRRRNANEALRRLEPSPTPEQAVYRGWMLTPDEYEFFYSLLRQRNLDLVTTPEQYVHCHWLPNNYPEISNVTPHTVWIPTPDCFDMDKILMALHQFGGRPLVIKDYVKSRKHEWFEACFIPDSSDETSVAKVTKRFLELQDDDLQGGLVFREYLEFQPIGTHPKSGMPLTLEYRLFVVHGKVISATSYWDLDYNADVPSKDRLLSLLCNVQSPFFSCDIARRTSGDWLIVELGDGQVAGLPERCDVLDFYHQLSKIIIRDQK